MTVEALVDDRNIALHVGEMAVDRCQVMLDGGHAVAELAQAVGEIRLQGREVSSARISCDDTVLQCAGRNQPILDHCTLPLAHIDLPISLTPSRSSIQSPTDPRSSFFRLPIPF